VKKPFHERKVIHLNAMVSKKNNTDKKFLRPLLKGFYGPRNISSSLRHFQNVID